MKIKDLTLSAVFAGIMCTLAPVSIPIGLVPLSLASLLVCLSGGILGLKKGTASVLIYIALGAFGLPVFSGFEGGLQKITGVTGGYILGYIPMVVIIGIMTEKLRKRWAYPLSMTLGMAVCHVLGTAWLALQMGIGAKEAILSGTLSFAISDLIKIAVASALTIKIRTRLSGNVLKG